ncbi:gliding motility-associated C-terminal domain-containing protein [Mucilaginibacter sp. McL0603]|uniref:T9SS type B sorting domain-containing protein n=1 Tax=Mucilaginibacter sp. McL0603 TaxID=3415670 RepID=UPI003CF7DEB1
MMHKYCLNIFLALFLSIIWGGFNSVLAQVSNQTIPNGATTTAINFPATGCSYKWVNNTPGIGLPASGNGNIPSFTASNTGNGPVTATITATPVSSGFAYITNSGSNDVTVINVASHTLVKTIPVGVEPWGEAISHDGTRLYVANASQTPTTSDSPNGSVSVINTLTNIVTTTIPVDKTPFGIAISPDDSKIYVTNSNSGTVSVINTALNAVTSTILVSAPTGITISPDGKWLYVLSVAGGDLALYVINTIDNTIVTKVPTNSYSSGMAISPDGSRLYITKNDASTVMVVNTATNSLLTTIPVGGNPYGISVTPDGSKIYVTTLSPKGVYVISTINNTVLLTIPTNGYPYGISMAPDGSEIYVATENPDGVAVINTATNAVTNNITAGLSPISLGNFISAGTGCNSAPITFKITVNGASIPPPSVTAPNITYTTPQNYFVSTAITPLAPTNSGGAVPATIYGQVSTLAGSGSLGYVNNTGTSAQFNIPYTAVADAAGNLYVADANNNAIRKVTPTGAVTTFAGSLTGAPGFVNATGTAALFSNPDGIAIDASGNFFVGDYGNNAIRKITPAGVVSTFYQAPGAFGPTGVCFDNSGNLIVSAQDANQICSISPAGVLTIIAGSPSTYVGYINATGTAARFNLPEDVQVDASGNIYVADYLNNAVRMITPAGVVTTVAGSNVSGNTGSFANGVGTVARFNNLTGVAIGSGKVIYVADLRNNDIRRIMPDGTVSLVAGSASQAQGSANGTGTAASFFHPIDLYIDATGTGYVTDARNGMIRKIVLTGYTIDKPLPPGLTFNVTTGIITGTPTIIFPPTQYTVTAYNGGGFSQFTITITVRNQVVLPVVRPHFSYTSPQVYTVDVLIPPLGPTTTGGPVPATIFGSVSTFAGKNGTSGFLDATGTNAEFSGLWGIDIDASGNLYVADNIRIRKITPAALVTSLAGGNPSNASDGTGTAAGFNNIAGLTVSPSGNIFAGDINNRSIRQITPGGAVTTFAGSSINLFNPIGVTSDQFGNLFVADQSNDVIREILPDATSSVFAGNPTVIGSNDGPVAVATFNNPSDVKFDVSGNLYVADQNNNMIREIGNTGIVSTLAGTTTPGLINGPLTSARFTKPSALATDPAGDIYIADAHNLVVRMINQLGVVVPIAGDNLRKISADGIGGEANFYNAAGLVYTHGVLYATDQTCVRKIVVTGYTIEPSLPIGLNFDSATGVISGTPTSPSPATAYTITGYNEGGNYSTTVTISVILPAPVITYPTPQVYTVNTPITPLTPTNTGGAATSYTADQPLPAGLTLNPVTGIISGTPTVVSPATNYTITASNSGGSGSFTINITVVAKVLTPQTITFNPIPQKTYGDADFDPGALSTNNAIPIIYTSDNTAVATIVNGNIHITGAGTANITASQAGNADFIAASPVTEVLTVNKALLTITVRDETRFYGTPNPEFIITYTGFVYGETQAQLIAQAQATTPANETSPPGEYPINISGELSNNYTFNPIPGTLTIIAVSPNVVIPNAFTPNGDGYNDLWNIPALAGYPQCMVSIYNRYGGLIYQSRGYPSAWDGIYNGSQLPTGTYYYIIDLKNGTKPLSGYVALIR